MYCNKTYFLGLFKTFLLIPLTTKGAIMPEKQQTQQSKNLEPSSQRRIIPSIKPNVSNTAAIIQRARIQIQNL